MKYKVAQIIPYFGRWPEWIELYFYSCGQNPMVDFIFYTDCSLPKHQYRNTIFHPCTYDEYCSLISERLGVDYHCDEPYKLTDLKPFIGVIHESELKGYDFWGIGDIDLVYGDLSMLVNDDMLEKFDIITTHNYHIAAHCCFCRNNNYYRTLCFKIKDWERKITLEKPMSLDEGEWSDLVYPQMKYIRKICKYLVKLWRIDVNKYRDFMSRTVTRRKHIIEYWTSPQPKENEEWIYNLKDNKITDPQGRSLPYLHFLFFKKTSWLSTDLYWRDDYWKFQSDVEKYNKIVITGKDIHSLTR